MPTVIVPTDHATVQAAIDSIGDAGVDNVYTVSILPGTYPEPGPINRGLHMADYVNLVGVDRDTCVITSNGGGALQAAINNCGVNASISDLTLKALSGDRRALHLDHPTDWFAVNNCVLTHVDGDPEVALGSGGRAGMIVTLTDITVTAGRLNIHGDVSSRGLTDDIWQWTLDNVTAPEMNISDTIEYKDNTITFANCNIDALSYSWNLTHYNNNPGDPLFNQGYTRTSIYLYDEHGNTFDTLNNVNWVNEISMNNAGGVIGMG